MTNRVGSRYIGIKVLSASRGDLPSGLAAYVSRSMLRSSVTGERFSYLHKAADLAWSDVFLPDGVDPSFKRPEVLWSTMERAEIRRTPKRTGPHKQTKAEHAALLARIDDPGEKRLRRDELAPAWRDDAQLAYHIVLAQPCVFSEEQNEALVRKFIETELLPHGFICQAAGHRPDKKSPLNSHAHILVATRAVDGIEVGDKIRDVLATFANKAGGDGFNCADGRWPDRWAAFQEDFARSIGIDLEVAPKSAIPEPHRGPTFHMTGTEQELAWADAKAAATEAVKVPGLLPELMVEGRSSFAPAEAKEVLADHKVPSDVADAMIEALKDFPALLPLFDRSTGRFSGRFTTTGARARERNISKLAETLSDRQVDERLQAKLAQISTGLVARITDPSIGAALKALSGASRLVVLEPAGSDPRRLLLTLNKSCRDAGFAVLGLAPTAGGARHVRQYLPDARTLARELHRQTPRKRPSDGEDTVGSKPPAESDKAGTPKSQKETKPATRWNKRTCIVLTDPDLLDPEICEGLLAHALDTGARLIMIGPTEPRQSIGSGGAYALVHAALRRGAGHVSADLSQTSFDGIAAGDKRQPSTAFSAPGDRRPGGTAKSRHADPVDTRLPLPVPRPWRWPGTGLVDIWNLSLHADCGQIEERLRALPPMEMLAVYRTLPSISDSGHSPNPHPLAGLHRQVCGHLRRAGINGVTGRTDVNCLRWAGLRHKAGWHDRADLAPRRGYIDVRPLLASIERIDLERWYELTGHMTPFPIPVLRDIMASLGDLFDRPSIDDDVRYAISFARLQLYVMAKDTGRDLLPEVKRDDLWSIVSSAERIQSALRYDDQEGAVPLILAATLPPPNYQKSDPLTASVRLPTRTAPMWLKRPAWSPLDEYGVHPDSGERRFHYLTIAKAAPEERDGYQDKLLKIFASARDLAMRAWCAVGLQHLASWHRQAGIEMPVELEIADNAANNAIVDWRFEGGYRGNPFQAAREQARLEQLARNLLAAHDRDRQLAVAGQIAGLSRTRDALPRYAELFAAAQEPAKYLQTRHGTAPDPIILGSLLGSLARSLGEPAPSIEPSEKTAKTVPGRETRHPTEPRPDLDRRERIL